jgi:hypothetical protein
MKRQHAPVLAIGIGAMAGLRPMMAAAQAALKESSMADDVQKNQGQNPGQSGQQSGQQQQKNPQDVSKKDPSQDRNKEHDDRQGQQEQGGQRPRFLGLGPVGIGRGLYLLRKSFVY